ncbi:MAG: hypothetical protein NZL96_01360 [Patescibacteria group bacterium]|nr:hypothetical protein [Patescibacteria group bacterium]
MKSCRKNLFLFLIFGLLIFVNLTRSYSQFKINLLFNQFDFKKYENQYLQSQWVIPNSQHPIGDDVLYTYAGVKYLKGTDPSLLNPEHPPLGKNLIGISALYLKNEYFFSLGSGVFCALSFFLLIYKKILRKKIIAFLLTVAVFLEPVFIANIFSTNLDLLFFGLFCLYLFFTISYQERQSFFSLFLVSIFFGFMISVKVYLLSVPVITATVIYLLAKRNFPGIFFFGISLLVSFFILIVSYFQYFLKGHSFLDFLSLQKYIFAFHVQGRQEALFINPGLFELLFFGRYYPDLKKPAQEAHFSPVWPIITYFGVLGLCFKNNWLLPIIWSSTYIFFNLLTFPNVRYLIPLLPFVYLFFAGFLVRKIKID